MKKILFALLAAAMVMTSCSNHEATIQGKINNYQKGAVMLFMKELSHETPDTIPVNENGEFTLTRTIDQAEENVLIYSLGEKKAGYINVYSMPGETLTVTLDPTTEEKTYWGGTYTEVYPNAEFQGKAAQECRYLNLEEKYQFDYQDKDGNPIPFSQYAQQAEAYVQEHRDALEGTCPAFRQAKEATLDRMLAKAKLSYFYNEAANPLQDKDFMAYVASFDLNDTNLVGHNMAEIYTGPVHTIISNVTELDSTLYPGLGRTAKFMQYLHDKVQNQAVRDSLGHLEFNLSLSSGKVDTTLIAIYGNTVDHDSLYDKNMETAKTLMGLVPGVEASDFEMYDRNDKKLQFHSVIKRGKVTYIDFWATWCGPCCAEIPFVKKLVEKFQSDDRIQFVSISLDENVDAWKKKLQNDKPSWEQYVIPDNFKSTFAKEYNINAIPRFMIFDGEGKIISIDAQRPSEDGTAEYLKSLLK